MARKLRQCIIDNLREARAIQAPGAVAAAGGSAFDTVVAPFLMCSVEDPAAVLQEIAQVLKRDGQYLFVERRPPSAGQPSGKPKIMQALIEGKASVP
jgi:SAM-dependent methyltransferase